MIHICQVFQPWKAHAIIIHSNTFHCFLPVPQGPQHARHHSQLSPGSVPTKMNIFVRKSLGLVRKMVCISSCPEVSSYKELHVNTILDIGWNTRIGIKSYHAGCWKCRTKPLAKNQKDNKWQEHVDFPNFLRSLSLSRSVLCSICTIPIISSSPLQFREGGVQPTTPR